jgi:hypothetical protein
MGMNDTGEDVSGRCLVDVDHVVGQAVDVDQLSRKPSSHTAGVEHLLQLDVRDRPEPVGR